MKYSFKDWNNQYGTIPVTWQESDYKSTEWTTHNGDGGFETYKQNYDIYKSNIGVLVPCKVLPVFEQVQEYFNLKNLVCDLSKYKPGMLLPWHSDTYPTYSRNMSVDKNKIVRIIVFLHDSQPGHQLWIENKLCAGPAGSWFSWSGTTRHMAANLGESDRYVIQLTGHI